MEADTHILIQSVSKDPVVQALIREHLAKKVKSLMGIRENSDDFVRDLKVYLGPQTLVTKGKGRWWVWELEGLRVRARKQACEFLVPKGSSVEEAFKALEDIPVLWPDHDKELLTWDEKLALRKLGHKALGRFRLRIGSYPQDELKAFVMGVCNRQIWTDKDVRSAQDMSLCFPLLAMGALSISDKKRAKIEARGFLPPEPRKEPEEPESYPPKMPKLPTDPPKPEPPELQEEVILDPEAMSDIEQRIGWQQAPDNARAEYEGKIKRQNEVIRHANDKLMQAYKEETLAAWEAACAGVFDQIKQITADHDKAVADYHTSREPLMAEYKAKLAKWELVNARRSEAEGAANMRYAEDIGCVWDWFDKCAPRSVNGMPMFFSLRLMNRADWERAHKAIMAEIKRRQSFTV